MNREIESKLGIPQHYGLFYAMGTALVAEGIFSGCYHVCPNASNFQFGSSSFACGRYLYMWHFLCTHRCQLYVHVGMAANFKALSGETPGYQRHRVQVLCCVGRRCSICRHQCGELILFLPTKQVILKHSAQWVCVWNIDRSRVGHICSRFLFAARTR